MTQKFTWEQAFCNTPLFTSDAEKGRNAHLTINSLPALKDFLDLIHIKLCLIKPYYETKDYPLVESRELLPSFEADMFEFGQLPGFSLVALNRPINFFQEIFQFDILHDLLEDPEDYEGMACPLERTVLNHNNQTFINRLPRMSHQEYNAAFADKDISDLDHYVEALPFLLQMDRAHVLSTDNYGNFTLSGIYASFPSDLDAEIKRFGLRMGKFQVGDNTMYERNRVFVYQFLMELYGFPIVSERRTSAALFARRLHKIGEDFLVRVCSQSDRTITTLHSSPSAKNYPMVEKLALVRVDKDQKDIIERLREGGFFLDQRNRVVIMRVKYQQHKYNPYNVRQDRALSVESQEVVHPLTGSVFSGVNIIKDTYNMFLRLNDIVRGEYQGSIVYKRNEVVINTESDQKRLKFLYAWLSKHQRRIISYSDDFFANIAMVLDNYLLNSKNYDTFQEMYDLFQEVWSKYSYIQQARLVRKLEDVQQRRKKEQRYSRLEALQHTTAIMHELKFEIVNYFDELVSHVIHIGERILADSYLRKSYVDKKDTELTPYGQDIKRHYRKLVSLVDSFKDIRKVKKERTDGLMRNAS